MAIPDPPQRKRRDNLVDQLGAPVYTDDPVPPYISVLKDLIYISYRTDPLAARAVLPPGFTPVSGATVTLAFFRLGAGFGLSDAAVGFFAIAVEEFPAPDTSEAAVFIEAIMSGPSRRLASQHYGRFRAGGTEVRLDPDGIIRARMWADDTGDIVQATLRPTGPLQPQAANDRYIGRDDAGRLVASFTTVNGPDRPCEVLSLTIADTAPSAVRQIAPREVLFGIHDPELLFSWSAPQPPEDLAPNLRDPAGRVALLAVLDQLSRACAILSAEGRVLHANAQAQRLLARLPAGGRDLLHCAGPADQARLRAALKACSAGRPDPQTARFLLRGAAGGGPLLLRLTRSDPALAGRGAVLALLSDPAAQGMVRDPGLLQLLGLTPAEARIAAAVGAGLPPRVAASSLGLAESTVRSSLKTIFDKLGVKRQAELVRLIARLDLR
jgi:DNA-binding CsgD family transcriptional regulator/PAS domain-containing protein